MRCLLLFTAAIFFCCACIATGTPVYPFPVVSTAILDTSLVPKNKLLPRVVGDVMYVLVDSEQPLDSLHRYYALYNVQNAAVQRLVVPHGHMEKTRVVEYFHEKDRIVLVHISGVVVFEQDADSSWQFRREYEFDYPVLYALKHNNTIHMWNDRIPARKLGSNFYCLSFDLDSEEITIREFPKPAGAYCMAVGLRNVLTRTAGTIAIADITSYSIRLYGADSTSCDTIARQPREWVALPAGPHLTEKGLYNLPAIDSITRSVGLVSRLTFLNDSTLLVVWSTPVETGVGYRADVWCRTAGTWSVDRQDIVLHGESDDGRPYALPVSAMTPHYTYSNHVFMEIVEYPLDYRADYYWASYADCRNEAHRYFVHYPKQYMFIARRYKPN